jgi:hypothetical protein
MQLRCLREQREQDGIAKLQRTLDSLQRAQAFLRDKGIVKNHGEMAK